MAKKSNRMASRGFPNPIDVWMGNEFRRRRVALNMSQTMVAEAMGLTFQQVQKYERGANRITISRLFDFCRAVKAAPEEVIAAVPQSMRAQSPAQLKNPRKAVYPEPAATLRG